MSSWGLLLFAHSRDSRESVCAKKQGESDHSPEILAVFVENLEILEALEIFFTEQTFRCDPFVYS